MAVFRLFRVPMALAVPMASHPGREPRQKLAKPRERSAQEEEEQEEPQERMIVRQERAVAAMPGHLR